VDILALSEITLKIEHTFECAHFPDQVVFSIVNMARVLVLEVLAKDLLCCLWSLLLDVTRLSHKILNSKFLKLIVIIGVQKLNLVKQVDKEILAVFLDDSSAVVNKLHMVDH